MTYQPKPLSQRDTQWSGDTMGLTSKTIGDYGCTITCLAMAAGLTPREINERMTAAGAYQGALVLWTKVQAAVPWLQFEWRVREYENDRVKAAIEKNGFCLVEVDFDGKIGTPNDKHWVLYIGGGQMIDPWTGVVKATSYYPLVKGYAIINRVGEQVSDMYKGLDLTNRKSMEVAVDVWYAVVNEGAYVTKEQYEKMGKKVVQKEEEIRGLNELIDRQELDFQTNLAVAKDECQVQTDALAERIQILREYYADKVKLIDAAVIFFGALARKLLGKKGGV